MEHLQRSTQVFDSCGKGTGDHPPGFHTQNRTQPLATGENAVAHGAMNGNRTLCGRRQQALQSRIGQLSACLQGVFEHDGEYSKCALVFAVATIVAK